MRRTSPPCASAPGCFIACLSARLTRLPTPSPLNQQTLDGHAHNIATVCFHPELPLILTGSEDGTVKLWHSTT